MTTSAPSDRGARITGRGAGLSRRLNYLREKTTHIRITDQGCMLRAYGRDVIDAVNASREVNTFIPALAYLYARIPTEIEVVTRGAARRGSRSIRSTS